MQPPKHQRLTLEAFEGSLDLLVQLVQRHEIPIETLTLQEVVCQLVTLLEASSGLEESAEALTPAAHLLLIKSRMLLPTDLSSSGSNVPETSGEDLMQHVIDYCRFRQVTDHLSEREEEQSGQYRRATEELPEHPRPTGVNHLELQDLVEIVEQVLKKAVLHKPRLIEEEQWRVSDAIERIRKDLTRDNPIPFAHYFSAERSRGEMIVLFLAILEMMKIHELRVIDGALVSP